MVPQPFPFPLPPRLPRARITVLALTAALVLVCSRTGLAFFSAPASAAGKAAPVEVNADAIEIGAIGNRQTAPGFPAPPMDRAPLTAPVYNALHGVLISPESFADTLYANIALRRMIEDYLRIRRQAQELLGDIDEPAGNSPYLAPPPQTVRDFQKNFKKMGMMGQELHALAGRVAAEMTTAPTPAATLKHSTLATAAPSPTPAAAPPAPGESNTFFKDIILSRNFGGPARGEGTSPRNLPQESRRINHYQEEIALPWIIRAPIELCQYLIAHTIEALIYAGLLVILLTILSAMRTKQ